MTVFDRYLFSRFVYIFAAGFVSLYGLYMVIDAFSNMDQFQEATGDAGTPALLMLIVKHYAAFATTFFDLIGPIMTILCTMVLFAMLQKNGELYPIFAAGIPLYRLAVPVLSATVLIHALLMVNQELIVPQLADFLERPVDADGSQTLEIEPAHDFRNNLMITGRELLPEQRQMTGAEFVLPVPTLVQELTTLTAETATYVEASPDHPRGWLLTACNFRYDELNLTEAGRQIVRHNVETAEILICTDIGFNQLRKRRISEHYIATADLMSRIRNPSLGLISVVRLSLHLHRRLTRPIMNIMGVLMTIPLVVRRESWSLVTNLFTCSVVMGTMYAADQAFLFLGRNAVLTPDAAAWCPIFVAGVVLAWVIPMGRT